MAYILVTLECAYDTWKSEETRKLFCDVVGMKLDGYQDKYFPGVLPFDATDLICSHQLICEQREGKLMPLMGFRSLTLDRATHHRLPFPALGLAHASGSKAHVEAIEAIVTRCRAEKRVLSYESAWTMLPEAAADAARAKDLHRIFRAMKVLHLEQDGIDESLLGATLRFKVPPLFYAMGYQPLALAGVALPPIGVPSMGDEKVVVVHLKQRTAAAMAHAERYRALWDARLVIAAPPASAGRRAA